MIRLALEQGSMEWVTARLGIPTCSGFSNILTAKKLELSTTAPKYRAQLLAEWICGYPIDFGTGGQNAFMARGTDMEAEARLWYEMQNDVDVDRVGFIMRDDGEVGGSPDGFVGDDGIVELKCLAIHNHLMRLENPALFEDEHRMQCMGYMYLSGREWTDLVAYHPDLPKVVRRIERDEKYIAALDEALATFIADLNAAKERFAQYRAPTPVEALAG